MLFYFKDMLLFLSTIQVTFNNNNNNNSIFIQVNLLLFIHITEQIYLLCNKISYFLYYFLPFFPL